MISTIPTNITRKFSYLLKKNIAGVVCVRCGNWYKNLHSLATHRSQDCGTKKRYQCPICDVNRSRKHDLKRHMQEKHACCDIVSK